MEEEKVPATMKGMHGYVDLAGSTLQLECHQASRRGGWWQDARTGLNLLEVINAPSNTLQELLAHALVAQKIALIHSELTEALEGYRSDRMDDKLPHRKMIEVELADAVIRIFDLAGAMNMHLGAAITEKLAYNAKRADHKPENRAKVGGKRF